MSAGGLSYSGLKTQPKVTLPSVEMWGTNMNILKDPSRSIHTRRVDKVGDTQSILLAQDESGDRICEMINVYSRGVNPMVSVSYDNYSNNAGTRALANTTAVSLPYKVENVRPPVLRQEDLLPLSRLPRNWFYSYTNPSFPELVQAEQCNEADRCLHPEILRTSAFTNKGDVNKEDRTQIREASSNSIGEVKHLSTHTRISSPYQNSLREQPDTGAEKKSIIVDKTSVRALTNPSGRGTTHLSDSMDGRRVHSEIAHTDVSSAVSGHRQDRAPETLDGGKITDRLHVPVETHKYSNQQLRSGENDFLVKDNKQIQQNKRVYEAFSQKGWGSVDAGSHEKDVSKFIHKDKYLCIARTNQIKENFVHPMASAKDTIRTNPYLYKDVRTRPTSVFHVPLDETTKDPKALVETPLRVSGQSVATQSQFQKILPHENLSREYTAPSSQPYHVSAGRTASIHVNHEVEDINKPVHDSILHVSTESARSLAGGDQPTADSIMTFQLNPYLYTSAQTRATRDEGGPAYISDRINRELRTPLQGSTNATKTFLGGSHLYEDSLVNLHNEKKTPLQSATTNMASPYSKNLPAEFIAEQRRRVLLTETPTTPVDPAQIQNVSDVYQIQSRDGKKQIQALLPVGGFEGQGSAVPVFDQYEDFSKTINDPQRDRLRQRTQEMFHERFPVQVQVS